MRKQRHQDYTECPVEAAFDLIGGKWKAVIIFPVMEQTRCSNELRRLLPKVTQRMLTNQLRELERDGLLHREVYAQVPPRVEYSLTEFGRTLIPILMALKEWGEAHALPRQQRQKKSVIES